MDEGYVKLFRQIRKWRWYDDPNTKAVFLHCIISANRVESEWRGIVIPQGSFVVGIEKMGIELGLTRQQMRTAITRLKSTNEITTKTTNRFTIINVANWALYQTEKTKSTNKNDDAATIKQPTSNQQITINKNIEKEENEENIKKEPKESGASAPLAPTKTTFVKPSLEAVKAYAIEKAFKMNPECFFDYFESKGWKVGNAPMKDWKAAARNWERRDSEMKPNTNRRNTDKYVPNVTIPWLDDYAKELEGEKRA